MSKKDKFIYSNVFYQWAFTPKHNVNFTLLHWSAAWHYFFCCNPPSKSYLHILLNVLQPLSLIISCVVISGFCRSFGMRNWASAYSCLRCAQSRYSKLGKVPIPQATTWALREKKHCMHWLVQLFIKNMTESEVILSVFFLFYIPHCF